MVRQFLAIIVMVLAGIPGLAATHYVVPPETPGAAPIDPYTNWTMAGTSIIDVVKAAMTNTAPRMIWVTNGTYAMTNQIIVTNALTLQSVNGRDKTTLTQDRTIYSNRCIQFWQASNVLDGFTISNYYTTNANGTVYAYEPAPIIIQNCLFTGNTNKLGSPQDWAKGHGGGIHIDWIYGTGNRVTDCIFRNNYAFQTGGGIRTYRVKNLNIEGCLFENNIAAVDGSYGGACNLQVTNLVVSNCVFMNNRGKTWGGGLYLDGGNSTNQNILNCTFIGNANSNSGGAIYGTASNILIRNCLFALNRSETNVAGGAWINNGLVENCTIVSNSAGVSGGGLYITSSATGRNNIVYFNTAPSAPNFTNTTGNTGLYYSCVLPAVDGTGNITNDPSLIDLNGGNYRLRVDSPCINVGANQDWMTTAYDLDGRTRLRYRTVDLGAYEVIYNGTFFTIP